jgi:uncharacterized membrane protein
MDGITIVTLTIAASGVLFIALGIPLYKRRVPPNILYGCRTEKSLSDEKIWYAVNRVTGRDLIVAGILVFLVSAFIFPVRHSINDNLAIAILFGTLVLSVARMVVHSCRALRNA